MNKPTFNDVLLYILCYILPPSLLSLIRRLLLRARLFTLILAGIVKIFILSNTHSHSNTFRILNSTTINYHSVIVKNYFKLFYLTKYYFNFKFNHFKYFYPNTHSHSNSFKMFNLFCPFKIKMIK